MARPAKRLRVAFIHPDLGIGGAERLVVDAALGLQKRGHLVDVYTSHHDPEHCFDETKDGTLRVHHVVPPFPRAYKDKFHILFAHARQLHLTLHLLHPNAPKYDVFFVDQLSTCIPFLRTLGGTRVVFYCHFPDKLLADGAFQVGRPRKWRGTLKEIYRFPMDLLEEMTTRQADVLLANSKFTSRVFKTYFSTIRQTPRVIYPGINFSAYDHHPGMNDRDVKSISSDCPTLVSINRFEKKKNIALAVRAFAKFLSRIEGKPKFQNIRLVLAGGYDPRLLDNVSTLETLIHLTHSLSLTYNLLTPVSTETEINLPLANTTEDNPQVVFLLNFTTPQRTELLSNASTLALLYTPENEHFGIGPVEGMYCGVPVLACDSGGPTESVVDVPEKRTGWLRRADEDVWADALVEMVSVSDEERAALAKRAKTRARTMFGMDAMASSIEGALYEAVDMDKSGSGLQVWWVMLFGFLLAYLLGPFIGINRFG